MSEIVRYADGDLELVLESMMDLERQVEQAMVKTHKQVIIETEIKYFISEDQWEGLVIISDAKKSR